MSYTKKAAAFGKLVGICAGYEGKYNPAHQNLQVTAIRHLATEAEHANYSVIVARQNWTAASGKRKELFGEIRILMKRLRGELGLMATDPATKNLLNTAISKVSGFSNSANADPPAEAITAEVPKSRRTSGKDYASRLAAFESAILVLDRSDYKPSSPELTVQALNEKLKSLKSNTEEVNSCLAELTEARNNRRRIFHQPVSGITAIVAGIRNVIKSIFGNPSDELKNVRAIRYNG